MATSKPVSPKSSAKSAPSRPTIVHRLASRATAVRSRASGFLARRPHRSFRRTRRRDYVRSLTLPGYWSFGASVVGMIRKHFRLFLCIVTVYTLFTILFVGIGSEDSYSQISDEIRQTGTAVLGGDFGELNQAGLLLIAGSTGAFNVDPSATQQLYGALFMLLLWLTTVWLLRAIFAGKHPRFRDGLYNSGAPVISTLLVGMTVIVQLLPLAVAVLAFSAAQSAGFLSDGIESMILWMFMGMLAVLSLYWLTSTFVALIVVTLPGMYPLQALRIAGDLVIGRRLRLLFRLLWLAASLFILWAVVMIPVILFDAWIKGLTDVISWLPVVPFVLVAMGSITVTIAATYVYMLYRKMVDDDAAPA